MSTILVVAWTATCLAIIHNRHLRRVAQSTMSHIVRAILARTQKNKEQ